MSSLSLSLLVGVAFVLNFLPPRASGADPLDVWQWRNPLPTGHPVRDATFADDVFVAVGDLGTILTSADGVDWTTRVSGVSNTLLGIGHGNGMFVVVGQQGTLLTSTDGAQWVSRSSGVAQHLNQVVQGNGQFVVVGNSGTVLTSPDGATWTPRNSGMPAQVNLLDVAFGNGRFVATTCCNLDRVLVSLDAVTWTSQIVSTEAGAFNQQYSRIAFGNGLFAVVGSKYVPPQNLVPDSVHVSIDGSSWSRSVPGLSGASVVRFLKSQFIATTASGLEVFTSVDTVDWSPHPTGLTNPPTFNLAFGAGRFLLTGSVFPFVSSTDLVDWTPIRPSPRGTVTGLATGNGRLVAVGGLEKFGLPGVTYQSESNLLTSIVGGEFTNGYPALGESLSAVLFATNTFVAVGNGGTVLRSLDGVTWSRRPSATLQRLFGLAYGGGQFVAVGENGAVITSPNGSVWTYRQSGTQSPLYGVGFGPAGFVAVGYLGTLLTSPDGITWTAQDAGTVQTLFGITSDGEGYLAVGEAGTVIGSTNAVTWTPRPPPTTNRLYSVAFGGGFYVAVGAPETFSFTQGNVLLTSTNGSEWVARFPGTKAHLFGVSFTGNSFLVLGNAGTILESGKILAQSALVGRFVAGVPGFEVTVLGDAPQPSRLQAASDLLHGPWTDLAFFPPEPGPKLFVDTNAALFPKRFYRLVSP